MTAAHTRWLDDARGALAAEHILDAAGAQFAARGVDATGMAEVAGAAGCSRATLYRYFDSRRALHTAFVSREARRIAATVGRQVAAIADPSDQLVQAVGFAVAAVRGDPTLSAWFSPSGSGTAVDLARASEVIDSLAAGFLGDPADPDVRIRSSWLVRVIVSLLAMPGDDADSERAMIERFVAPVLVER